MAPGGALWPSMQHTPNDRPVAPGSPCTNVCVLDATGYCRGCLRTGDEIARWRDMSAAEQWGLIGELEARRHSRARGMGYAGSPPDGGSNES